MTSSYDDQPTFMPGSAESSAGGYSRTAFPYTINRRYRCVELIGQGSSGAVYRAYDTQLQREVAIKFIHHGMLQERKRLLAEGRVLAHLEHPHICNVFEVAEEGEAVYLVMSLIRGQHLNHWRENLSERQRIELMAQVCDAVAEAHRRGIVHCDIKPGNIVIQEDVSPLTAVLIDFGLADSRHYATTSGAGTEHYMAPERFSANAALTPAIDIYALGATLRLVLTGAHSDTGLANISRDLRLIIAKCMHNDPAMRYQSAATIAADLRAVLAYQPISSRSGLAYRGKRLWQRKLWLRNATWISASIVLIMLFAGGMYQANLQERQIEQVRLHEQVTRLESQIDSIYRSPVHQSSAALNEIRGHANTWVERADSLPTWMAASQLAAAGRVFLKLGNLTPAQEALSRAWALGERSDSTAMALAQVYRSRYTEARAHALNLPTANAREQALAEAHETLRIPALDYLLSVEQSELPSGYIDAMKLYLQGDELGAITRLQREDFPSWFYDAYALELELISQKLYALLIGRQSGDPEPFVERFLTLDETLQAYTPSSTSVYVRTASTFLEFTIHLERTEDNKWHRLALQRVEQGLQVDPTHPQLHRYLAVNLSRGLNDLDRETRLKRVRQAVRHYELAIRYAKVRNFEPRSMATIYSSYYNQLRSMQTVLVNLGMSTQSLFHRSHVIGSLISSENQGALYHLNTSRDYRYLAQHSRPEERDYFWQLSLDAIRTSYEIAPSVTAIQANYGILLFARSEPLSDAEATPFIEEAIHHLSEASEKVPDNAAIFYNYARAMSGLAMRHDINTAQPRIEKAAPLFELGMEVFPSVDFFNHLYVDIMLFRPTLEQRQWTLAERLERAHKIMLSSSNANPGLGQVRHLIIAYQRWRLSESNDDFEQLLAKVHETYENEYLRSYFMAASALLWTDEATIAEHQALLQTLIERIPGSPDFLDRNPTVQLLQPLANSFKAGKASDGLVEACAQMMAAPIWLEHNEEAWQTAARLAQVAEAQFELRCLPDDHPELFFL